MFFARAIPERRLHLRESTQSWIWLLGGSLSFLFVGWRLNVPIASWAAPFFLLRFYRSPLRRWPGITAVPLLAAVSYLQLAGAWRLEPWHLSVLPFARPATLVAALAADRALHRRLLPGAATLVFPSAYLCLDYFQSLSPFGTLFSLSATQFGLPAIAQLASLTGSWGIGFLINWSAAVANLLWERSARGQAAHNGNGKGPRPFGKLPRTLIVFGVVFGAVLAYGTMRAALLAPTARTVRVAAVTVSHPRDYWTWIAASTPRSLVEAHLAELAAIEEELFRRSDAAVAAGARILLWSEADAVLTPQSTAAFYERAAQFARDHEVYLAAAVLELLYGRAVSDNKVVLFTPTGECALVYGKTMSLFPTISDGALRAVDTPYGRLAVAVSSDMDFPLFVNALGRAGADIVLVPAYDSVGTHPYVSYVAALRAVENGFAMVRQANEGTSLAVDAVGHVLARQDYFETSDRTMIADVPIHGRATLYALVGDWFAFAGMALCGLLVLVALLAPRSAGGPTEGSSATRLGRVIIPGPRRDVASPPSGARKWRDTAPRSPRSASSPRRRGGFDASAAPSARLPLRVTGESPPQRSPR